MNLILHTPDNKGSLTRCYQKAFSEAVELFIITAYLTDWDDTLHLNSRCSHFRIIIGRDFGITRKAACKKVMNWLPEGRKAQFKVADGIAGFHPKAVFWRAVSGDFFAIIGSSNLTRAAFETNYEANIYGSLSSEEYEIAKKWVKRIEERSVVITNEWLKYYVEGSRIAGSHSNLNRTNQKETSLIPVKLPRPKGLKSLISERRGQLREFGKHKAGLVRLFQHCADGKINSTAFYERLPGYWSGEKGDRLQGKGWEIKGKHSDFRILSQSIVKIIDVDENDRDDIVAEEIDRLAAIEVPTRRSFLSEMLCLNFPDKYHLINNPVHQFLGENKLMAPRGSSEGAAYIYYATALRAALVQDTYYPAKNLAELDAAIWGLYWRTSD
jgi:HKD family nuclease